MVKNSFITFFLILLAFVGGLAASKVPDYFFEENGELLIPTIINPMAQKKEPPLQRYAIPRLKELPISTEKLLAYEELDKTSSYTSYLFTWETLGKVMTGQVNIPTKIEKENPKTIVLLRGYVPEEIYETGVGTANAAAVFAKNGYVTVAPDFFGYGGSDPEPIDTWQARFEKPQIVMELLQSIAQAGIQVGETQLISSINVGIWAHSNGGQIALSTLESYELQTPTTLWAPVSAPFPYAIQFFSDELADEGKTQRKWISIFEDTYDTFDFSVTQHITQLKAPLQFHHGELDDAAPIAWSNEFVEKIETQNEDLPLTYYTYKNTDHNMQPSWNTAISRDLSFFKEYLEQ